MTDYSGIYTDDFMREHRAMLAELAQCYGVPPGYVPPAAAPAAPPARPVVTRYGVDYCPDCGLMIDYCRGHAAPDSPSKDGAESLLDRRIAEAQARRV